MRHQTYSFFQLAYGPVLMTSDKLVRDRMDRMDKRMLAPWAEALALSAEAEALMTMPAQGSA